MKKVMILLAVLLTANVMMAQKKDRTDAYMYNKNSQFDKAMVAIEKCVNHEQFLGMKPKDQATAWHYRAMIYQNVIESKNPEWLAQAGDAQEKVFESLTNCMKDEGYLNDNKADIYQRVAVVMNNYYQKGADAYNASDFTNAAPAFKKAYDIAVMLQNPDANDMLKLAASSCIHSKDYETALAYYSELQKNGYNQPDIFKSLASVYNAMGNNDKAFEMISAGLEVMPNDPGLLIEKVNLYINQGKSQEALNDLLSLNKLDPGNVSIMYAIGTIYGDETNKDLYNFDKAVEFYSRAIEIKPDFMDAVYNLGIAYLRAGAALSTEANELDYTEVEKYNALMEQSNGMLTQGLPYIKQSYDAQPSPELKKVLKQMYSQLKMYDEAKALDAE